MASAADYFRVQRSRYDPGMGLDEICDALNDGLYFGASARNFGLETWIASDALRTKWYRADATFSGTVDHGSFLGYNITGFGQIEDATIGSVMIGMEADYNDGSVRQTELHMNLAVPGGSYKRPFSAFAYITGANAGLMQTDVLGDMQVNIFSPLLATTAAEVRITNAGTTGPFTSLISSDTGGKSWQTYSTGSAATGGAGNLLVYNATNSRYGVLLVGGASGGISLGINATTASDLDGSSLIQLGNSDADSLTDRSNIRWRRSGIAAPSNANATSNGDKVSFYNASSLKIAQGIDGGIAWFQCNGSAAAASAFKWYGGTNATPAEHMTLSNAGLLTVTVGGVKTAAPSGGTSATWKLGIAASVSPTSPNRTIELDVGGTIYYLHAKTTNN